MALDFRNVGGLPDSWLYDTSNFGQADPYGIVDPLSGNYRQLAQSDIDSYLAQQQQAKNEGLQRAQDYLKQQGDGLTAFLDDGTSPQYDERGYAKYNFGNGTSAYVPVNDPRFMAAPQHNDSWSSPISGIAGTTLTHFQDVRNAYQADPSRALFGGGLADTPIGTQVTNSATGKDYQPLVNQTGGPTQTTYNNAAKAGYDTGPTEFGHQLAPAVVGIGAAGALSGGGTLVGKGTGAVAGEGAVGSGIGSTNALDPALAGGGEVGSGYAASAPGTAGTTSGTGTLAGSAGNDTLSQGNNGMWDYVDNYSYDPGGEGVYTQPSTDPYGTGTDIYGNPTSQYSPSTFQGDTTNTGYSYDSPIWQQLTQKYGPQVANQLKGLIAKGGGAGGRSTGGGILDSITGNPGDAAFNSLPFLYSLYEANRQGNQVDPILAKLSGLADTSMSNTNGLVASATGPYDRETMAGRDALMADQSARGVRGSSFGDQGITSYDTLRGRGRGELVGSTQAKALGLTGGLLGQQLQGTTNAATSRNLLIGAGLSASGKLFQPQTDPFGLANLLALGASGGNNNLFGNP